MIRCSHASSAAPASLVPHLNQRLNRMDQHRPWLCWNRILTRVYRLRGDRLAISFINPHAHFLESLLLQLSYPLASNIEMFADLFKGL